MATKSRKVETTPFSVLGDAINSAAGSFEEVSVNARDSAKKAATTVCRALCKGIHGTGYGLSYGVIYASVFLTELWPEENPWRRGLEEGTHDALEARRKVRAQKAEKTKVAGKSKSASKTKKAKGRGKTADEPAA